MAGPVGGDRLVDAKAHHHVEVVVDQRVDHARGARGVIGRIAIDQHIDVGIDIGEHAPDHMPLALAALAAHDGAGAARDIDGAVLRIVVVDENFGGRQRFAKIGNDGRDGGFLVEARHQNRNSQRRRRHCRLTKSSCRRRNQPCRPGKAAPFAAQAERCEQQRPWREHIDRNDIIWRKDRTAQRKSGLLQGLRPTRTGEPAWPTCTTKSPAR